MFYRMLENVLHLTDAESIHHLPAVWGPWRLDLGPPTHIRSITVNYYPEHHTVFPHPSQNIIPYFFLTWSPTFPTNFTWNCWNLFTYREYFKILDMRGHGFLTIWFYLWSNIPLYVLMNWVIFSTHSKTWNFLPFPDFLTHFPTLHVCENCDCMICGWINNFWVWVWVRRTHC